MKRILLVLSLIIAISFKYSYAQEHQFGVQSGFGISGAHQVDELSYYAIKLESKPYLSYSFNLVYTFKYKKIGVSIEPGYLAMIQKRESLYYYFYDDDYEWPKVRKNSFFTPLLFNWYISDHIYLSIGPEFEYHISTTIKELGEKEIKKDYDDKYYYSAILGINFQILKNLDFGLRYRNEIPPFKDKYYFLEYYGHLTAKYKITLPKKDKVKE